MAQFLTKAFQIKPNQLLYQQKRFRAKINLRRPRKTHYTKSLMETFLTPYYEKPFKDLPIHERCQLLTVRKKDEMVNPHEEIVARDVRNWFDNSKMIAFLNKNSMNQAEEFELTVALRRKNMYLKFYGYNIVQLALKDSPYGAVRPLMSGSYLVVFSPDIRVVDLHKILKKFSSVALMAGVMYGKLLDVDHFLQYGKMDLVSAQTQLVQVLQSAGGNNLNQQLTHHQTTLISRLKQIGAENTPSNENVSDESVPV